MAIVRTTPNETGTTGSAPPTPQAPVDRTRSVVRPQARPAGPPRVPPRGPRTAVAPGAGGRAQTPARPVNARAFLDDTVVELRRVVWPSRDSVRAGVIVTIGLLIFFGLYITGFEKVFEWFFTSLGIYPKAVS